jgi:isocitrate dehydrogenase
MVYISGEEMTHYACNLIVDQWIQPYFDISAWETYDLSCKSRDHTNDQVLKDAVEAGKRIGAIFKEPTITPSAAQVCSTHSIPAHSSIRQLKVMLFLYIILGQGVWVEQGLWISQWRYASGMEWHYNFEGYDSH